MNACAMDAGLSFRVPVLRWSSWPLGAAQDCAAATGCNVAFVEGLLRRRLSPLARMALHVAHACAQDLPRLRLVFASRHGELDRTMAMLEDLARCEPLSPTAFSLSVHNAAAGIFSIARRDPSPATAVAAGDETLAYALLEAYCQFQADRDWPVLMVYADEPLPDRYRKFAERPERPHAIGVLLADGARQYVTLAATESNGLPPAAELQSLAFLPCLAHRAGGRWTGSQRTWTWH